MKKLITLFLLLLFLFSAKVVFAKRILPHLSKLGKTSSLAVSSKGITAKVKFRGDRRAITTTFSNLTIAKSVDYSLSYTSRGTQQGAGGSIALGTAEPVIREIIFGTCSHGVCRYDTGITNARFIVTTTLKNGKKVVKTFRLKV